MNLQEFKKLKNYIDQLVKKLTDEAINEGIDITSPNFELVIKEFIKKILAEKNISYDAYKDFEKTLEEGKELSESEFLYFPTLAKKFKENRQKSEEELKEFFINKVKILEKEVSEQRNRPPQIINKIVKEIPQIIKTREIIREPDNKVIQEVQKDLFELQSNYTDFINKTREFEKDIKIAKDFIKDIDGTVQGKITPEMEKFAKEIHSKLIWVQIALQNKISAANTVHLVPYMGATSNVNLGSQNLTTTGTITGSGLTGVVIHGATAGTARPTGYTNISWIGSVEPTNAINNDVWINTT